MKCKAILTIQEESGLEMNDFITITSKLILEGISWLNIDESEIWYGISFSGDFIELTGEQCRSVSK
jgi:hypothetical protein